MHGVQDDPAYRTLRGAVNARITLDAGFTTVRNLGLMVKTGGYLLDVALQRSHLRRIPLNIKAGDAALAINDQRRRAAHCNCVGQREGRSGQAQRGLDMRRSLVAEHQKPTAHEWKVWFWRARDALRRVNLGERLQHARPFQHALREPEQEIEAPRHRVTGNALHQERIALRGATVERKGVDLNRQIDAEAHGPASSIDGAARLT
jgi:hypothetical protein